MPSSPASSSRPHYQAQAVVPFGHSSDGAGEEKGRDEWNDERTRGSLTKSAVSIGAAAEASQSPRAGIGDVRDEAALDVPAETLDDESLSSLLASVDVDIAGPSGQADGL
jgi:hypothetical protein